MVQFVDPAVEEALYDSQAMRRFVDIDLGREPVPDETTACCFRYLLERTTLASSYSQECSGTLQPTG
jgi:transposase, IS5 family